MLRSTIATCVLAVALAVTPVSGTVAGDEKIAQSELVKPAITFSMIDLAGETQHLGENDTARTRAFVFLSTECPIANAYTKTLNDLHDSLHEGAAPVDLYAVISDPTVTRSEAAAHYSEFEARFTVLFDATGELAEVLAPSHTPRGVRH